MKCARRKALNLNEYKWLNGLLKQSTQLAKVELMG